MPASHDIRQRYAIILIRCSGSMPLMFSRIFSPLMPTGKSAFTLMPLRYASAFLLLARRHDATADERRRHELMPRHAAAAIYAAAATLRLLRR